MIGQTLAALAQPFLLCAPTKLAGVWFGANERGTANMIASLSRLLPFAPAENVFTQNDTLVLCPEMHIIRRLLNFISATLFNITISIRGGFFSGLDFICVFFSLRNLQEGWARTLCHANWNYCNASKNRLLWTYCDTIPPSLLPADFALQPCKGGGGYSIPKNEHSLLQKKNFVP